MEFIVVNVNKAAYSVEVTVSRKRDILCNCRNTCNSDKSDSQTKARSDGVGALTIRVLQTNCFCT